MVNLIRCKIPFANEYATKKKDKATKKQRVKHLFLLSLPEIHSKGGANKESLLHLINQGS